jgi:hypothetical protein
MKVIGPSPFHSSAPFCSPWTVDRGAWAVTVTVTVTVTVYLLTHLLVWQRVIGNMRQKVAKEIFAPAP